MILYQRHIMLKDISSIKIDIRKSSNERILDFLTQVKNPYVFKVNGNLPRRTYK